MESTKALRRVLDGVDTVIHLGAGRCRELPEYLAAACGRIVLVEANPRVARMLQTRSSGHDNVRILRRAISGQSEVTTLNVYNLAERSSLRKATGLLELYPGLRLVEKVPVTAYSPASVLAELDTEDAGKICLVVDTPGEEHAILQVMARENLLERVSTVLLHCAKTPMYEGSATRQDIIDLLDTQGFEFFDEAGLCDLESVLALRLNRWKLENSRLQKRLDGLATELRDTVSRKDAELRALADESNKFEHQSALQQQAAREEKERARHAQKEMHQLQQELKSKETELAKARQDLGVALRLQMLRQNDLEELQQRYGTAIDLQARQHQLLLKLQQRLSVAAEYLRQIRRGDVVNIDDKLAQRLVRALTASADEK